MKSQTLEKTYWGCLCVTTLVYMNFRTIGILSKQPSLSSNRETSHLDSNIWTSSTNSSWTSRGMSSISTLTASENGLSKSTSNWSNSTTTSTTIKSTPKLQDTLWDIWRSMFIFWKRRTRRHRRKWKRTMRRRTRKRKKRRKLQMSNRLRGRILLRFSGTKSITTAKNILKR